MISQVFGGMENLSLGGTTGFRTAKKPVLLSKIGSLSEKG